MKGSNNTLRKIKIFLRKALTLLHRDSDRYLNHVSGVIHVGANVGQERNLYAKYGLPVLWIEPIPEVFKTLEENLQGFTQQRAINCLITDQDDAEYEFHVANNNGASSSILEFNQHKEVFPHIEYEKTIKLRSKTLPSLLATHQIDYTQYDLLAIDTQGTEILVLHGAISILRNFAYIKTEAADFESYAGSCQLDDLTSFLTHHGYKEYYRHKFKTQRNVGNYYDIVYKREA